MRPTVAAAGVLFALAGCNAPAQPTEASPLPAPGRHRADVMALGGSGRGEELALRVKQAAQRDPQWFALYVRQHEGEVLPWHAKMGVSEAEYQELMREKDSLAFRRVQGADLVVTAAGSELSLSTGGTWRFFDDLALRVAADGSRVTTAKAALAQKSAITASAEQKVTGPWSGTCWSSVDIDETRISGETVKLCLGRFRDQPRAILYYEARSSSDPSAAANSDFALYFDP